MKDQIQIGFNKISVQVLCRICPHCSVVLETLYLRQILQLPVGKPRSDTVHSPLNWYHWDPNLHVSVRKEAGVSSMVGSLVPGISFLITLQYINQISFTDDILRFFAICRKNCKMHFLMLNNLKSKSENEKFKNMSVSTKFSNMTFPIKEKIVVSKHSCCALATRSYRCLMTLYYVS